MKLVIDIPEKDWRFVRNTYQETGCSFVPTEIKNECTKAVYKGTPYEEYKTGKWNVIVKTPMTEEEKQDWAERLGVDADYYGAYIYGNLPEDGQEVLICTKRFVYLDTFCNDSDGVYFENQDIEDVVAWMPLPKPYKEVDG